MPRPAWPHSRAWHLTRVRFEKRQFLKTIGPIHRYFVPPTESLAAIQSHEECHEFEKKTYNHFARRSSQNKPPHMSAVRPIISG